MFEFRDAQFLVLGLVIAALYFTSSYQTWKRYRKLAVFFVVVGACVTFFVVFMYVRP